MNKGLREAYRAGRLVLFVGAGVSMNLGLPSWGKLIARMATDLGYDPDVFETYGNHLALAEFYKRQSGSIDKLRKWMDKEWHGPTVDVSTSEVHRLIAKGNFPKIYTTNYDRWLEIAHAHYKVPYTKVSNVLDIATANSEARQIVKFHGDVGDSGPIVLDETSYYDRLAFDSPLDIKLNHDVLGSSVLFIGYSLSDLNIRLMFYRLAKLWGQPAFAAARPKSYLFSNRPNPVNEEVLRHWGIEMEVSEVDDPKDALIGFLKALVKGKR